jgi:prefoldin subunit 5
MTDIKGLSANLPLTIASEPQTEPVSQNDSVVAYKPETSDTLEQVPSHTFDLLQPPGTLDAAEAPTPEEARLQELQNRLEELRKKQEELKRQLQDSKDQTIKMQEAAAAIKESLDNDEPLSQDTLKMISGLGDLATIASFIAGLPFVPLVSGIISGLSTAYRQKLEEAAAKLDNGMNEINVSAEGMKEEIDSVNEKAESVKRKIQEEELRLSQPFKEQGYTDAMTVQTPWEEIVSPEKMIADEPPSAVPPDPNV